MNVLDQNEDGRQRTLRAATIVQRVFELLSYRCLAYSDDSRALHLFVLFSCTQRLPIRVVLWLRDALARGALGSR